MTKRRTKPFLIITMIHNHQQVGYIITNSVRGNPFFPPEQQAFGYRREKRGFCGLLHGNELSDHDQLAIRNTYGRTQES
jgi:hypothetical protein